jgi:hypothetical protein
VPYVAVLGYLGVRRAKASNLNGVASRAGKIHDAVQTRSRT